MAEDETMVGDGDIAEKRHGSEEREGGLIPYVGVSGIETWIKLSINLYIYIYIE